MSQPSEITELLRQWGDGDAGALDDLIPIVYRELHRIARGYFRGERASHTLQPTALVQEAYIRLLGQKRADWRNSSQFFGVAAQIMRRILVDHARRRVAAKRGGGAHRPASIKGLPDSSAEVLEVHEALAKLERLDPSLTRLVELRFFVGLSIDETARALESSPATVKREWKVARTWLFHQISQGGGHVA